MEDEAGEWIPVLPAGDLPAGKPVRAAVGDLGVFLFRSSDRLFALADACSHQGGPLHRGRVDTATSPPSVTCPIHGSRFLLTDGRVMRGPAMRPQPVYEVREQDGMIQIRDPGE